VNALAARLGLELRADRTLSCGRRVMAAADDEGVARARDGHAALSARESRALRKLLREAPTSNALSACSLRSSPSEISSRTLTASSRFSPESPSCKPPYDLPLPVLHA
jgi:hypothetical protein